jgi:hypothetical protein
MRSGWERTAHHLLFDTGPLGCAASGGHGHADLLSIQCAAFGEPFLVDPGTASYVDPIWRTLLRTTGAYRTLLADGASQAVPAGPFKWESRPTASLTVWEPGQDRVIAEATHEAYARLPDPVRVRRRVVIRRSCGWLIVDDVDGCTEHRVEVRFQFAPLEVSLGPDLWARARAASGRGLLVRSWSDAPLKAELVEGDRFAASGGWRRTTASAGRPSW